MATEVEILLKAIDQASAALNQVRGSSEKLGKGVSGLEKNWNSMKSNVPGLSNVLALATNPITLVTAGVGAMAAVMKAGVSETVAYNKTIREMSQVTGVIPEEISRIVQAADDWGISIDSVRTALQMANKNGYQPSIEMLANMADEYVNTADKQAFAAEAIKVFGKQYATLIPLLSQGGDELRKMTDAVDDNLVATQKEIDASREYEVAVDSLGDEWTGFKQVIGNSVIPILTDLLTKMLEMKATNQSIVDVEKKVRSAMDAKTLSMEDAAKITAGLRQGTLTLEEAIEMLTAANKEQFDAANKAYPEEERFIQLYKDLKVATVDLADEQSALSTAIGEVAGGFDEQKATADLVNEALKFVSESSSALAQNTLLLELATEDLSAAEIEEKLNALDRITALQTLNDLLVAGTITYPQWVSVMADGVVTQEEINALLGITSDDLSDIERKMLGLDGFTAQVGINMNVTGDPIPAIPNYPGAPDINFAAGTDFIIPPGFDQDNYPLGFGQSGERVVIIPKNQAGNSTVNNNFNMTVHTNAGISSLMSDYNRMKAMVS